MWMDIERKQEIIKLLTKHLSDNFPYIGRWHVDWRNWIAEDIYDLLVKNGYIKNN
ncbi:hypothetical protein LCGC14_1732210 [marine sediment metagenome]|uniref:Uncharacterized protein n=1 Tax=marine sediment metagenome TaxID=412755 RepID=A0A0F9K8W4_9ZZZZ